MSTNNRRRRLPIIDAIILSELLTPATAVAVVELPVLDGELLDDLVVEELLCSDCDGSGIVGLLGDDEVEMFCLSCCGSGRA